MKSVINRLKKVFLERGKGSEVDPGFKLLPDKPIKPDKQEDIRFGHKQIINTIFKLIRYTDPPLAIGLYGNWGTGKTTIVKSVEELVKQIGYQTLYFDVWKYEQDSLRRQFLIELDRKVFDSRLQYEALLNQSLSWPKKIDFRTYVKEISKNIVVRSLGIGTIVLLGLWGFFTLTESKPSVIFLSNAVFQLGLLGTIISFILKSFEVVHGTVREYRTDSAEGFEAHFKNAFEKKELKDKTLFVIIDNLDRVENSKVISVLSDIKTFLTGDDGEQKVVFLIPCDYESLRVRLSKLHGDDFDADEFFRKFFNLSIRIPKFIDIDLFNYIRDLLKETKVEEYQKNSELGGVIYASLKDNPREIKQFINSLTTQVLLARERQLQVVLDSIAFLAKLLVIRQKFPKLYLILEEESIRSLVTLDDEDLAKAFKRNLVFSGWSEDKIAEEIRRFEEFNGLTPGINVDTLDVFLTLRQSDEEKQIPEWKSYVLAAEEKEYNAATKIFSQIKKENNLAIFDQLLKDRVERVRMGSALINFVAITLQILGKNKEPLKEFFDAAANHFPYDIDFNRFYKEFDPQTIFKFWYSNISNTKRDRIVPPFIALLEIIIDGKTTALDQDYALSLLTVIAESPQIFQKYKKQIGNQISDHFFTYPYLLQFRSKRSRELFVLKDASGKFVDSIDLEDFENPAQLKEVLRFWNRLSLPTSAILNSFKKYRELVKATKPEDESEIKLELSKQFVQFSKNNASIVNKESDTSTYSLEISAIAASFGSFYDQMDETGKKQIISAIDYLSNWKMNSNRSVMDSKISNFIESSSDETLRAVSMRQLKDWTQKPTTVEAVLRRSQKNPIIFLEKKLYEVLSDDQNQIVVMGLINNGLSFLPTMEAINFNISDKEAMIVGIIQRIPALNTADLAKIMNALKELGIGSLSHRVDELKNRLIEQKSNHPAEREDFKKLLRQYKKDNIFNKGQLNDLGIE
ncbi:MAG: KAP family NTPase [Patescibacteria group bacterium]|nr:KAP family NTPase [Patescibacteria group bacterium]